MGVGVWGYKWAHSKGRRKNEFVASYKPKINTKSRGKWIYLKPNYFFFFLISLIFRPPTPKACSLPLSDPLLHFFNQSCASS
jgi:hypothetical protein